MNETGIIWTEVTWNPASGCERITSGCAFCYAHTLAENKRGTAAFPKGFDLTLRPHKLAEPLRLREPALIFVNSMSDLFWEQIPDEYRDRVVDVIEQTPQHQYQVLTKRPERMLEYSRRRRLPDNFWAGTTIEEQKFAHRADTLRQVQASIRFVSAEPLLSPLALDWSGIHWCITGGESGVHLMRDTTCEQRGLAHRVGGRWVPREDRMDWVRRVRDDCVAAGTRFFHKQWGGLHAKSAGRTLDGRTWDEFPRLPQGKADIRNENLHKMRQAGELHLVRSSVAQ
jgi:protein gp37